MVQGFPCRRYEHFRKYLLFVVILMPAGDFWFFSSKEKNVYVVIDLVFVLL